ncbi:MAG: hypothetical protein Devi2KO_38880 [Devosia indica]
MNGKRASTIIGSLPSGLYRRPRNYTGSADPIPKDGRSRADVHKDTITAGGELHPALRTLIRIE